MEGSIAKELYSGIPRSSSVEIDRGLVATETDHNLQGQETDDGELWYDDGSSCEHSVDKLDGVSDMDREWQKRYDQFHTIGYRDGVIAGKEFAAQEGFNIGFKYSVKAGYRWGHIRGITRAMACIPDGLEEKLVETKELRNKFQCLDESVQSLSPTDALKLFYEDQKRKLVNETESVDSISVITDLNSRSTDDSVLVNYYVELRSILGDTPLVDARLDINQ